MELHPEDADITNSDIKLVTLENVITVGQYNDLGFLARGKIILLVEAQSTHSPMIPLRMLMYLANTYSDYVKEEEIYLYSETKTEIPRPELYVVYTGKRETVPNVLRLSDLYDGPGSAEIEVKVLRGSDTQQILGQYVGFCTVFNEQVGLHGRTTKAVSETIQICLGNNILVPFLESRQKEVHDIMTTLFKQEDVMKAAMNDYLQKGRQEGIQALVLSLQKFLKDQTMVAKEVAEQFGISQEMAMKNVQQYWGK